MTKPPKEASAQVLAEIEARDVAVRKNMERLRALRLAKEAEDAAKPKPAPATKAGARKTGSSKSGKSGGTAAAKAKKLSDWLAGERAAGRKT